MRQTLLGRRLWVVGVVVCLLVGLTTASARVPGQGVAASVIGYGLRPVEASLTFAGRAIGGLFGNVSDLWSLKRRNQQLAAQVATLQAELLADSELKAQDARLTALLQAQQTPLPAGVGQGIAAEVIGRSPDNWFASLVVDRGSSAGIKAGMVVVDPTGLVGQVASANPASATVNLITNPAFAVGAMVAGSSAETEGVVTGNLGSGLVSMRFFSAQVQIPVGSQIVTSGLGGVYPAGLPIGVVTNVGTADFGFTRQAMVRPTSQLGSIEAVLILRVLPQVP